MSYIIHPGNLDTTGRLGRKAGALAALRRCGLSIPAWFVLAPEAFDASLSDVKRKGLKEAKDGASVEALLEKLSVGPEVRPQLSKALAELCPAGERVAVRSSACDEDGSRHSFAGQLDSFLFVRPDEVADKVAAVWRSAFSERVLAYRREHGLDPIPGPPAVLIQRMVNADRSGVAFGADPVSGRWDVAVVAAVYGLGTALVSGQCDADTYYVDRQGRIAERHSASARPAHRYGPSSSNGLSTTGPAEGTANGVVLDDEQIRDVAQLVRRSGRHFGRPQDIEWAIEDGRLYLLQSRPITSLSKTVDPDGTRTLWDNSNIAESYGGVTTPLTFSFARHVYSEVYRQFCRLMRVPDRTIAAHNHIFRCMLGLVPGRVYYNLLNWYRLLALLPGFAVNRRFMEQMMGVREGLPDSLLANVTRPAWHHRVKDLANVIICVGGLTVAYLLLPRRIRRFRRRLESALGPSGPAVEDLRADELAAYYRDLERQLISRWDAPLINDFFTMMFFGLLGRLTERWCGDTEGGLRNELVRGDGEVISARPARWIRELAEIAARDPGFAALLRTGTLDSILTGMDRVSGFESRYARYLSEFGDRCPGELKLESPTLHDDPLPLLRSVGQLALRVECTEAPAPPGPDVDRRRLAECRVRESLAGSPVARVVFHWVLANARAGVRDREELRLERTRLFGRVRRIFLEIGKRFYSLALLDSARDIFYLDLDEILGFIEGTSTSTNLRGLVRLRKAEFSAYRRSEPPPDRFETVGIVHHCGTLMPAQNGASGAGGEVRKGMGCSPGVARGPVRLITDPRNAVLQKGEILVAERTDPGWVLLFPCASGLLVERGSLLSHSAIVARELGIPAVIAVGGVTRWLKDGDVVELDGSSGEVRRLESKDMAHAR